MSLSPFLPTALRARRSRPLAHRRCWALAAATTLLVLGHAGPADAQFGSGGLANLYGAEGSAFMQGEVSAEERTFQAPSRNILGSVVAPTKVTIPIQRTAPRNAFGAMSLNPLVVNWRIGNGPAGSLTTSDKDVDYTSGTVVFDWGVREAAIEVNLRGLPPDGRQRQFTLSLGLAEEAQTLYRLSNSSYAQTLTAPVSFNCELRDRQMSIQVPPDGEASWCPERHPNEFRWTHPIMVNGIRLQPLAGTTFTFNTQSHVLSSGGGRVFPSLRCGSCSLALGFAQTAIEWTSDNSGPNKTLSLAPGALFGFSFKVPFIQPIKFTDSYSALLPVYLGFPEAIRRFADYSVGVVLRSQNPGGLVLEDLRVHADSIPLGAFTIKPLDLYYNRAEDLWGGHVGVRIPTVPGAAALREQSQKLARDIQTDLLKLDPNEVEKIMKVTSQSPGVRQYAQDQLSDFLFQDAIAVDAKLEVEGGGRLRRLELGSQFNPPIPLGLPGVGLHGLRGMYASPFAETVGPFSVAGPYGVTGTVTISAGPAIGVTPAFSFDGTLGYLAATETTGWQLLATGTPKLFGLPLASGGLRYVNGQSITARFSLGSEKPFIDREDFKLGFGAEIEATMFFEPLDVFALAGGHLTLKIPAILLDIEVEARAAINKNGVSGCTGAVGATYRWNGDWNAFLGCDNDLLRRELGAPVAAAAASAGRSMTVPRGVPYQVLQVKGPTPPELRITGPGGFHFETPADRKPLIENARRVRFISSSKGETWVQIMKPRAGRYSVTPIRGTSIASLAHASGLREPVVRASVSGRGAMRTLRYRVRQDSSQTVNLVETAGQATRLIKRVRGSRSGTLRFRPAPVMASGTRDVKAFLQTRGTPAGSRTLARYDFSEPRVRAPRVSVRARRGRVRLSWQGVRNAMGYELVVALSDGQKLFFPTPARQRALTLSSVASRQNGIVTIRALDRLKRPSRPAQVRFRAAAQG